MNGHRIGVAAIVVMLALSGGMAASAITSPSTADTVAQTDETPTALQELNASVTFDDQTTSNTTVTVQNVTLAEGGYVALHDSSVLDDANASIEAESVVGVSDYLEAGTHENVTITLYEDVPGAEFDDTTVNDTETLVAMLHVESSDDAPPTTPGNNTTEDNATDTPTTPDDNATDDNATGTPTTTPDNATDDNTTDDNTTTAPTTPGNDTGDNTTETTAGPNDGADNTTDDNATDGNATGDAVTGTPGVTQQNATETFDFVVTNGEEDGPYLVDGEPVTDVAEVTFEDEAAPDEATNDTEVATGDLVVEDLDAPAYAVPNSTITVNATVTNEAGEDREEDVAFRLEGGDVDVVLHQTVAFEANETTTVTFEVNTTDVPMGAYIHGVTTENSSEFDEIAVTNESAVDVDDQNLTDGTLTVDSVFVPEGGYVALHDSSVLDDDANTTVGAETVVGVSDYLEAGYHEDVNVTLYEDIPGAEFDNTTVNDTQTLTAVPHLETNATDEVDAADNATFDFVTTDGEEDGPYLTDGELVVDAATVTADTETNATA